MDERTLGQEIWFVYRDGVEYAYVFYEADAAKTAAFCNTQDTGSTYTYGKREEKQESQE